MLFFSLTKTLPGIMTISHLRYRSDSLPGCPVPVLIFQCPEQTSTVRVRSSKPFNCVQQQDFPDPPLLFKCTNMKANAEVEVKSLCHLQLAIVSGNVFCSLCTFS